MTRRLTDDVVSENRRSAQYEEINFRNLHVEDGNDVISSQCLTPPSATCRVTDTDRQANENDDNYASPISSNCAKYDTNSANIGSDSNTAARSRLDKVDIINDESDNRVARAACDDVTTDEYLKSSCCPVSHAASDDVITNEYLKSSCCPIAHAASDDVTTDE